MFGFFRQRKAKEEILRINGEEFQEKYKKGFFIVPTYAVSETKNPNFRTIFHKSKKGYERLNGETIFAEILKHDFYACKSIEKLKTLQLKG